MKIRKFKNEILNFREKLFSEIFLFCDQKKGIVKKM